MRSNTGMTWWAIGLAIIFAGWFISVLFYQFDDLPQPRGDVAEYFMPEMITFTRFLSNMMFISLRHLAGPGNNRALFYAVNALFSLLLVGVC
ncbi:MAG TPA: hypothetical protein PKM88_15415, partial [bacterium]|nr:hypothetical protein [bacterium]